MSADHRSALVIAHRGASGHAPEHTFAAWDLALEMGVDFLEQDLQMTADGRLVVLHDPTLDRTTDGTGRVDEHTYEEIAHLDAGSWFATGFAGERVHTLDAVFERYADRACLYVETKTPEDAPGMERELLETIDRFGLRDRAITEWRVVIQSFSEASLQLIARLEPRLPLVRLLTRRECRLGLRRRLDAAARYAIGVGPPRRFVSRRFVEAAHRRGLHVHPWTVNEPPEMQRILAAGVDGVFTDVPDVLKNEIRGRAAYGPEAVAEAAARWRAGRK